MTATQLQLIDLLKPPRYGSPSRQARDALYLKYARRLVINPQLNRSLISFQANKTTPFYRWLKFKEAFSAAFVEYILREFVPTRSDALQVLDPFAGSGTTLTTATQNGWQATGIELLPVGITAMRARLSADTVDPNAFEEHIDRLRSYALDCSNETDYRFPHIPITEKAFPSDTEVALSAYQGFLSRIRDPEVHFLFWFACLAVLEEVSYTRKDGQYLRWDLRAGKSSRSRFSKGRVLQLREALLRQLDMMLQDVSTRNGGTFAGNVRIIEGSTLQELPNLHDETFDLVVTSPPYCNRYDYTRTYALELAFMGYDAQRVKELRQALLSATVENKSKRAEIEAAYAARGRGGWFLEATRAFEQQRGLHEVLRLLRDARQRGELNNSNIPDMVEGYFFEMNVVIRELARVLRPGGHIVMVNDNVRYHGEEIPVDLILSDFAESAGLVVPQIWVLPRGKGNSSQQMGAHGRSELRKCVYVWEKPQSRREERTT